MMDGPGNLFDDYPDPTRDSEEESDPTYAMHEVSIAEPERETILADTPTCDMTPEEVEAALFLYPGPEAHRKAMATTSFDFDINRDTFVISGPTTGYAVDCGIKGRYFESRAEAKAWVQATYGTIIETYTYPHRWGYRVRKPTAPGGRYTPPQEHK